MTLSEFVWTAIAVASVIGLVIAVILGVIYFTFFQEMKRRRLEARGLYPELFAQKSSETNLQDN